LKLQWQSRLIWFWETQNQKLTSKLKDLANDNYYLFENEKQSKDLKVLKTSFDFSFKRYLSFDLQEKSKASFLAL
jgi:hypothetical protein